MKTKYMRYFWFIFIFLCSCNDYLDVKSNSNYVIPRTLKDIQGLLDDGNRMNMDDSYSNASENMSDDYYMTDIDLNRIPEERRLIYFWKLHDKRNSREWAVSYSIIYNANLALELLEKVERTTQNAYEWDRAKGSALFVRSFHFLALVTLHGHAFDEKTADTYLGIPLRMTSDFNVKSTRATLRECYDRILVDLQEASKLLPITEQVQTRPTKVAALALLARTNLYMGRYKEAGEYAKQGLQYHSLLMDFNDDSDILGLNARYTFKQFNKETIYFISSTSSTGPFSTGDVNVDSTLLNYYNQNDLRRKAFFNGSGIPGFKGSYSGSNLLFSGISTAELYLTLAESEAYLGNIESALNNLNHLLRARWDNSVDYAPLSAASREEALQTVRLERRKELIFRNMRWIDIKRYNREGANIFLKRNNYNKEFILEPFDSYYAFPLPQDIVEMTGIPQN